MIGYRHCDSRFPFVWQTDVQPPARWHGTGEGPVQYLADSPDGAWAEFLRHEEISDAADLDGIDRSIWAVELDDREDLAGPALDADLTFGGLGSYPACQDEARRLRAGGAVGLRVASAALRRGGAGGERVDNGLVDGPARDGQVVVLFGSRPDLVGWRAATGRPHRRLLNRVRHLG